MPHLVSHCHALIVLNQKKTLEKHTFSFLSQQCVTAIELAGLNQWIQRIRGQSLQQRKSKNYRYFIFKTSFKVNVTIMQHNYLSEPLNLIDSILHYLFLYISIQW